MASVKALPRGLKAAAELGVILVHLGLPLLYRSVEQEDEGWQCQGADDVGGSISQLVHPDERHRPRLRYFERNGTKWV